MTSCSGLDSDWISLFNGEDLSGWEVQCTPADRGKGFWSVQEGALTANSMGRPDHDYVWLEHQGDYGDFELQLQFQAFRDSPGNSGVQVRSRFDDSPGAPEGGWMHGPQIDVHPPTPWRTGFIYDETREERRWISPDLPDWNIDTTYAPGTWTFYYADEGDGWNDLIIICEGTRIRTILNGTKMADFDGSGVLDNPAHKSHKVGMKGHIALQLHSGDELRIRFRDLRLRRFTSADKCWHDPMMWELTAPDCGVGIGSTDARGRHIFPAKGNPGHRTCRRMTGMIY
ncbi:MAG TPA: DUF1080 domain-containing protein [bacterium]|nr:DUF1080 domain-containing protein [bacterium]